ncbi:MAG: hypothetical protein HY079_06320 [Elusimicrobia bacterium]|nr:hypothetical protein [Elusimicrobiota bacterium]
MASQTDIINLAMTHMGTRLIASLQENSESARRAAALWGPSRDEVLRDCPWNFATMIQPLALSANDKVIGWNYVYGYPSKCLLVRKVFSAVLGDMRGVSIPDWAADPDAKARPDIVEDPDFREMLGPTTGGKIIVSQLQNAYAEWTALVDDTTLWDALFVKAMSFKLAAELTGHLTGDKELRAAMEAKYLSQIQEAKRVNFTEGADLAKRSSEFVRVRG